jgi:hypothetical protein
MDKLINGYASENRMFTMVAANKLGNTSNMYILFTQHNGF